MTSIEISPEESEALRSALSSYLSELHMEIARTDNRAFKDGLKDSERLLQGIQSRLEQSLAREP